MGARVQQYRTSIYSAPRCSVCGRGAHCPVDLGGAVCDVCLRRLNADPEHKRRIVLGMGELAW